MNGLDIHGGLRIRLEYDKDSRTIMARQSTETGVNVCEDVAHYLTRLRQQVGYAEAWLAQYQKQEEKG